MAGAPVEIIKAIQEENIPSLEKALSGAVNWTDPEMIFFEPLHCAAQLGNHEMVKMLLRYGADIYINDFDDVSFTPLMWAAKSGDLESVKTLVEFGGDINRNEERKVGNTALREVVSECNLAMAECLVKLGADPMIKGWMQLTALDLAKKRWEEKRDPESAKIYEALKAFKD